MSNDITRVRAEKHKAIEEKHHTFALKKLRDENQKDYKREVTKGENTLERIKKDYEVKVSNLESDLEQKLVELRRSQEEKVKIENKRLDEEVKNIQIAHKEKVSELKDSQAHQIQDMVQSHQKTLDNAREKFVREKRKWEA